jgi:DNA polymerase III epsilon subunit-like protein
MKFINDKKLPMLQRLSKKLNKKLTFIDIETNDLVQNEDFAIIQLALIQISEDNIEERVTYVDPGMPIKEFATKLTGITNENVEAAPQFKKFASFISKVAANDILMGFSTKTFVAHGLIKECKKNGIDVVFNHQIDIKPLLLTQLNEQKDPKLTNISLEDAKKIYGIKLDEGKAHQADFDLAGTVFLAEEMLIDYGLKYFEKDYLRFLNKDNPEYSTPKKEKTYYNRELPNLNEAKPHMLDFIINSEKRLTDDEVAKHFGFDAFKISFILTDLINSHREVREKLKNPETVGWLSEVLPQAIKEVWADEVANGKLKPLFTHLNKIKPRDIDLDYTQLRIAQAELNNVNENTHESKSSVEKKSSQSVSKEEKNTKSESSIVEKTIETKVVPVAVEAQSTEEEIVFPEHNGDNEMPPFDEQDLAQQAMIHQSREEDIPFFSDSDDFTSNFEDEINNNETSTAKEIKEEPKAKEIEQNIDNSKKDVNIETSSNNSKPSMRVRVSHQVSNDENGTKSNESNTTNTASNSSARSSRFSRKASSGENNTSTTNTANTQSETKTTSNKLATPNQEEKVEQVKADSDDFTFTVNESDIEKELTKPKKRFSIRR